MVVNIGIYNFPYQETHPMQSSTLQPPYSPGNHPLPTPHPTSMSPCPLYKWHRTQFCISQRSPPTARWRHSRFCYSLPQLAFCCLPVSMQRR